MRVYTLPVYSRLAKNLPKKIRYKLPTGWHLSQHQVETYISLTAADGPDVIFNTAMTGDGKSLAGQLPFFVNEGLRPLFAMYPTNELIRDQALHAAKTWQLWGQWADGIGELDSNRLDQIMQSGDFRMRGEALLSELRNHQAVLTNPDIFHYIMQMFYRRQGKTGDTPDKVIGPLISRYEQFTFDEFHIFDAPQIVSVLNALLLINEMAGPRRRRFLFQSATPNPLLVNYLERAGLSYQIVRGHYTHSQTEPDRSRWRRILHGSSISFSAGSVEIWLDEHLEDTLIPFFLEHRPGAKGAIIVNSVAQAKRVMARLKEALRPHNLTVGENTGLTSRTLRAESYRCDILVGTSTVDVGVDFQINFLLFESRDAGSFLQRLGRLGRHDSYQRDGTEHHFHAFEAHAVLPTWTIEALFQGRGKGPPLLVDGMETDRETLTSAIEQAFPHYTDFGGYAQAWGALQSARVIQGFGAYVVRGQYKETVQRLAQRYQAAFRVSMNGKFGHLRSLQQTAQPLLDEAVAFRGGSYFDCGVLDLTEEGADQIKRYDLFALIANGDLGEITEEGFFQRLEQTGSDPGPWQKRKPVGYFRLRGFLPERTNFHIRLERDLAGWSADRFGVATVLKGVTVEEIDANTIPGLNAINRRLQRRSLPALLCLGETHPLEWKRRLRLPMLFPLFAFQSRDGLHGTVAFGREALLLDTALRHKGIDCGGGAIIC